MNNCKTTTLSLLLGLLALIACERAPTEAEHLDSQEALQQKDQAAFTATLEKHLQAVSSKDLVNLGSTMSPDNKMQLILPGSEIIHSADSFLLFHKNWFQDTSWTFETKILSTEVGAHFGLAVTEVMYREPERAGVPYFNRMIVTYGLQKVEDQWYIIMDHASSIEKSTDNQ
ncbi:MAG: nuclear transport factor 2 family protein [Saprospiraceae bacterium]|nr:nuclear transport factor 2 family protein [Saprospiraceae bacterium]